MSRYCVSFCIQHIGALALLNQWHVGLKLLLHCRIGEIDGRPAFGGQISGHTELCDFESVAHRSHAILIPKKCLGSIFVLVGVTI